MSQITRESEIYFSKVIYDGPLYTIVPLYSTLVLTHTMINSKYTGLKNEGLHLFYNYTNREE